MLFVPITKEKIKESKTKVTRMNLDLRFNHHQKSPSRDKCDETQRNGSVSRKVTSVKIMNFLESG